MPRGEPPPTSVVFHWHPKSIGRISAVLAGVMLLGVPMLLAEDVGVRGLGAVWLLVFAWALWALFRRSRSRGPVVTVDGLGILDRRLSQTRLSWDDIVHIETYEAEHQPYLGLDLRDPKVFLATTPWHVRWAYPVQKLLRFPGLSIGMSLLDGSRDDLVAAIAQFRPGHFHR